MTHALANWKNTRWAADLALDLVAGSKYYKRTEVVQAAQQIADRVIAHLGSNPNWSEIAIVGIDLQWDFAEEGNLAVNGGQRIGALFNEIFRIFKERGVLTVTTQDWHPKGHISFASTHSQAPFTMKTIAYEGCPPKDHTLWPDHCIQRSHGAELMVDTRHVQQQFTKGEEPVESYSIVTNEAGKPASDIVKKLKDQGITTVLIGGLATDYCVQRSAHQLKEAGFNVIFIEDLSAGVAKDTCDAALKAMGEAQITSI